MFKQINSYFTSKTAQQQHPKTHISANFRCQTTMNNNSAGSFTPETLAYLKQLTQEKKSKDINANKKINYTYILVTLVSGYLLYTKSASRSNHVVKFIICNIYPLLLVYSQVFGGNYNLAKLNRLVILVSIVANLVTFIWHSFYFWAFCLVLFLLIGLYNILKIVTNLKKNGLVPGMASNQNAYSHLQENNKPKAPSLMDSFAQTYDPLQKMKQQQNHEAAKRKAQSENVMYKSTNGMKLPENMSKGMKAALKIKDENGNDVADDEPLSKRQQKIKKKFEKMQRMNGNKGGVRS